MNDNIDMETSKKSGSAKEPGPQDQPLKDDDEALKNKLSSPPAEKKKEPPAESSEEEPGTFDRVYEHGRQMGF
ncbi:MAG TPA: hypothetical protein VFS35_10200 [Terrimicrobiaceae bacterium]|nr:hypothetical protein [Terrimicrobiaceae bacterium]